ncbi:hypothetical protein LTS10_005459 [Elasticomyces elasticus]|nr:hypothetical protein LTS10_005459 [Elasticomyces elasticus]
MASNPGARCCTIGVKHEGEAKGELKKIGGIDSYVIYPEDKQTEKAILILPDVIGHEFINAQLIADQFAANGYFVVMPDLFEGDPIKLNRPEGFDIMAWLQKSGPEGKGHGTGQVDPIVTAVIKEMRENLGVKKLGSVGYCFGAKYVARFMAKGKGIDVGAMAHPSFVDAEEIKAMTGPLTIAAAETDAIFPVEKRHETEKLLKDMTIPYQICLYSDVEHGFAVRADMEKREAKFAKEAAFLQHVQWFDEFVKEKRDSAAINYSTALAHANTFPDRLQLSQSGITITPTKIAAEPISMHAQNTKDAHVRSILSSNHLKKEGKKLRFMQSSLDVADFEQSIPSKNGFLHAIMEAYNEHKHLQIRPEDIWFAILTQLSMYINGHGEELRHHFVAHDGKKDLVVKTPGNRYTVNFGGLATALGQLVHENVTDSELREWILPAFSTTAKEDIFVSSVIMMGAMQKYFRYIMMEESASMKEDYGIPSVTLLGEKADYELILSRLEKLRTYGEETGRFADLLQPVIRRFIKSLEDPDAEDVKYFWNKVVNRKSQGSGDTYLSGWITAFCFWGDKGECLAKPGEVDEPLTLDGIEYHAIETNFRVPLGMITVPLLIIDSVGVDETVMVAGSTGIRCLGDGVAPDTMQPQSSWWIFEPVEEGSSH